MVWGCEHFNLYLYGAEFTVITDHKPIEGVMNNPRSTPTARLERLCWRLEPYKVRVVYRRGSRNTADYLSRHPGQGNQHGGKPWLDTQIEHVCVNAIHTFQDEGLTLDEIRKHTAEDPLMQKLAKAITNQKWFYLEENLKPFKIVNDQLTIKDGIILRGDRLVVPAQLQKKAIKIAHRSHQGIVKTKSLLRETLWFPGIGRQVEDAVANCLPCQSATHGGTVHEPLKMSPLPDGPWQEISIDFCGPFPTGEYLLVAVDDYSRFPEVEIMHSTSTQTVIPRLDAMFARHGIPVKARTDNGPPFNGELLDRWCRTIGMIHRKITPLWPKANGEAERFMRTLEKAARIAMICHGSWKQEIYQFLRQYWATPHTTTAKSPAELLYGRKLRTELPIAAVLLKKRAKFADKKNDPQELLQRRDQRIKAYMRQLADLRNHASPSEVQEGDKVLVRQQKTNKLSPPFSTKSYEVTKREGSLVTAQHDDHQVTRNVSCFKRVGNSCILPPTAPPPVSEDCNDNRLDDSTPIGAPPSHFNSLVTPTAPKPSLELRRSTRARRTPRYLEDFVK